MLYEQKGFPLTVGLDSHGEIMGTINGFRPAGEYQAALRNLLRNGGDKTADTIEPDQKDV
jgi:hypothetical protein